MNSNDVTIGNTRWLSICRKVCFWMVDLNIAQNYTQPRKSEVALNMSLRDQINMSYGMTLQDILQYIFHIFENMVLKTTTSEFIQGKSYLSDASPFLSSKQCNPLWLRSAGFIIYFQKYNPFLIFYGCRKLLLEHQAIKEGPSSSLTGGVVICFVI